MKKIQLLAVTVAIILAITSSFGFRKSGTAVQYNFEFTGYDMSEPMDWTLIQVPEPTCNYSSGTICYIKAEKDLYGDYPTSESLVFLSNNSNNFTTPYTGGYGKVRLKP